MLYTGTCHSPLGTLLLACSCEGLTGVWFEDQKYFAAGLAPEHVELETEDLICTRQWLKVYFSGQEPDFFPRIHLTGTPFQRMVWELLRHIPYGTITTYGALARDMAGKYDIPLALDQGSTGSKGIKSHRWVSQHIWGDHQDPYEYLTRYGVSKQELANDLAGK